MYITEEEVSILKAAQAVLDRIEERTVLLSHQKDVNASKGHDLGRLAESSRAANDQVFATLNIAVTYCGIELELFPSGPENPNWDIPAGSD